MERYKPRLLWLKKSQWNLGQVWLLTSKAGTKLVSKRRLRRERGRLIREGKVL